METAALKYCNSLQQSATRVAEIEKVLSLQHSATLYDPGTIELIACCCYCTNITGKKMAAFNEESLAFLEEVRKYDCLYNKFNKHFKNKFKKYNCWVEIRGDQQPEQEQEPEPEPEPEFSYFGRSRSRSRSCNCIKKPDQEPELESYYCSISFTLNFEQNSSEPKIPG